MNCKQAEELIPLYAGRDLEVKRATSVAEHVQTCAACARVADEYRQSVKLVEQFAPPVFSEAVYAGIRQRVLHEIETEAMAPSWSQTIASMYRPKLTWAIASMLLITVSMFAIYFIATSGNDQKQLVNKSPAKIEQPKEHSSSGPEHDTRAAPQPLVNTQRRKQQLAGVPQPPRKRTRGTLANRTETMVSPHRDSAALDKRLRVEIQTNDPRIRIIWFVQQDTKPLISSSKGT